MGIEIENLQRFAEIKKEIYELLKKALELSLKAESFSDTCEIGVMLVDNDRIREINLEQRNIDRPTDVLSFPIVDMVDGYVSSNNGDFNLDEGGLVLGDIVISIEKVSEQALSYGHSFERELVFLLTHGFFHLLGYDHDTADREKIMIEKQYHILNMLELER